jgi:SAM-dependent methyltransferase/quercetin dioxygenase-like cupin family protein
LIQERQIFYTSFPRSRSHQGGFMRAGWSVDMDLHARLEAVFGSMRRPTPDTLAEAWRKAKVTLEDVIPWMGEPGIYPYGRKKVFDSPELEILVMNWAALRECAPHDHGFSFGWVHVLAGTLNHTLYTLDQRDVPVMFGRRLEHAGGRYFAPRGLVHSMGNPTDETTVTLHVYAPPITGMKVYDLAKCAACVVSDDCGAWWPDEQRQIVRRIKIGNGAMQVSPAISSLVRLSDLTSDLVSNEALRTALRIYGVDLASLVALEAPLATACRLLTRWTLDDGQKDRVLRAPPGGAIFILMEGRVEFVPLNSPGDAALLGEGQTWELPSGQEVGMRLSGSSTRAALLEVSYDAIASVEIADEREVLIRIPPMRDYYYGYADRYAAVYAAGGVTWEPKEPNDALVQALDALPFRRGAVIDLGCGEGRDSIYLAARGFEVIGVDVARSALDKARSRAAAARVHPTFLERDVIDLRDLPEGHFDLAINMGCLHMIPDPDLRARHLNRVLRLLRPGGIFVLAHCRERWGEGFFSIPDYEAVGPLVPGRLLDRRIRLSDGTTTMLPLPLVPYKESSETELVSELTANGFEIAADLSMKTEAFGNTVVLAARRPNGSPE